MIDIPALLRGRWGRAGLWSAGLLALAGVGYVVYTKLLEGAWIRYNEWDRRARGSLQEGHRAPDLELPLAGDGSVRLSELWRERPVFLVFGSCT